MVKGRGSMALAGPHLVRAAVGEDVTQEELGGSRVHCRKSGVGDMEVASDEECIARIKEYLSYMPQHCETPPPVRAVADPIERREESLLDVLPPSNRTPYDMYEVIRAIVDDGEYPGHQGPVGEDDHHLLRALRRAPRRDRRQPAQAAGRHPRQRLRRQGRALRQPLQRLRIPLVFVQDVPGFMVGTKVEAAGIIRHGAKMLYAVANATVPKITVITRKAYGAGYYVMNGRAYEPDLIVAWPSAEISVMGAEGVVEIAFRKQCRGSRGPRGQARGADRGLQADVRRVHRRRQRPDRRRDRPA